MRRIFGPKRDEITGGEKIHNERLYGLYSQNLFGRSNQE